MPRAIARGMPRAIARGMPRATARGMTRVPSLIWLLSVASVSSSEETEEAEEAPTFGWGSSHSYTQRGAEKFPHQAAFFEAIYSAKYGIQAFIFSRSLSILPFALPKMSHAICEKGYIYQIMQGLFLFENHKDI